MDEKEKTGYTLEEWVVTSASPKKDVKATDWVTITASQTISTTNLKSALGISAYSMSSTVNGLIHGEEEPLNIGGEEEAGNTLYLLYLKSMPSIQTSDEPIPTPPAPTGFPTTTYPENPYTPTNPQPDKQGSYNIIKVYTILDQYDGTPKQHYTVYQTETTPFILINNEPSWTLASWFTTDTTNTSPAPTQIFKPATTQSELKQLYKNNYLFNSTSKIESTIGTILEQGTTPTLHYFTSGECLYLFFTKLEGSVNYNATEQIITESYIAKRFSTLGYWWLDNEQ